MHSRRVLQAVLTLLGVVALVAGALGVLVGAALVPDVGRFSESIDSELRFFAAWYAAAGVLLLRAVPRIESEGGTIRSICAVFGVAGCARLLSIAVVGKPHPLFVALTVIELAIPVVLLPWHISVARSGS